MSGRARPKWSRKVRTKQLRNASAPSHFRKIHPQRAQVHKSTHATGHASKQTRGVTTKKRKRATDDDSDDDDDAGKKRKNTYGGSNGTGNNTGSLDTVDGFHAIMSSTRARGSSGGSSHAAFADVFEWIGDAVIGELVGRCLLSQFHHAPLSARVFRNLRLAVVTNRNLAQVYEKMGYQRRRYHHAVTGQQQQRGDPRKKLKEKADIVEAVVGELVVRLDRQSNDERACALYRDHLDALLATMLHTHFADRTRARQLGVCAGPLSVSFNPFSCLPEEQLDEETGELVVLQGSFELEFEAAVHDPSREQELQEKSFADLIDEYKESESVGGIAITHSHHAFADAARDDNSDNSAPESVPVSQQQSLTARVLAAMKQLTQDHVLRGSKEIFEVFKVYGMTVLAERVSIALAQPHVLQHRGSAEQQQRSSLNITPAALTHQRQRVLSVANLAHCSALLGVSSSQIFFDKVGQDEPEVDLQRVTEERLRANTLRAFIGFHSAIATTSVAANRQSSLLVNNVCRFLQAQAFEESEHQSHRQQNPAPIPEREPLLSLMRSIGEAKVFMDSATCDALHLPGERPLPAASAASKKKAFLLRQCDSDQVENLFETLAKEHEREKRRAQDREREDKQRKRTKNKKNKLESSDGNSGQGQLAANLTRFLHRRFLFCLEEIVVLFAQRKTDECRKRMVAFESELEPCASSESFRKWEVSTSTLTLVMRDSFYRLLLHDVCQFHEVVSSSKTTRDGTRITQLRLPLHYTWAKNVARRITTEEDATS